jgi:hypothetical protein
MEGGSVGHKFERDPPKDRPCRVCLIWFRGFRGEDLNVKVYDVRRRMPSDGKSSPGLWPGELKTKQNKTENNSYCLLLHCNMSVKLLYTSSLIFIHSKSVLFSLGCIFYTQGRMYFSPHYHL